MKIINCMKREEKGKVKRNSRGRGRECEKGEKEFCCEVVFK